MPTTAAFRKAYAALNPRQKEAVDAIDGPVMVIAGPGTGKTQVLTLRIANILANTDAEPRSILALTFTEKAAFNMRERLAQLIGQAAYGVRISTFHAFCNEVISRSPDSFPEIIGGTPLTESEQLGLIERLVDAPDIQLLRPAGRPEAYIKGVIGAIGTIKGKGYDPKHFAATVKKVSKEDRGAARMAELARIYQRYEADLAGTNHYDYTDMLVRVAGALGGDRNLRLDLSEQYQYVLVDEHQDTNRLQNRIVQLITEHDGPPNLFVVGDLQQAIYRFQGASPENFRNFSKRQTDCRVIKLDDNYRSSQLILDAARGISPEQGKLQANAGHASQPIELCTFSTPGAMEYGIARLTADAIASGTPARNIAVLYRKNSEADSMAAALERCGVPYTVQSDQDVLGDLQIRKLLIIARAARNIGTDAPLLEALHVDLLNISPLDAARIGRAARADRMSAWDITRSRRLLEKISTEDPDAVLAAYTTLKDLARIITNADAAVALQAVVDQTGWITRALNLPNGHQLIAKLQSVFDAVRAHMVGSKKATLADFLDSLERLTRHDTDLAVLFPPRDDAVQLMTAHKAKGLEFDIVFIAYTARGHWDDARKPVGLPLPPELTEDTDDDDDIRRLMYVAITRSRKKIFLAWPKRNTEGRDLQPSSFVLAIPEELKHAKDVSEIEKEYSFHLASSPAKPHTPILRQKEYIAELLERQPLSVTALNNFLECPWKYYFTNLVRIPQAPMPKSEYGTAAHEALRIFFGHTKPTKTTMLAAFRTALARAPLAPHVISQLQEQGIQALSGWYATWQGSWAPNVRTEVLIEKVALAPGVWLTGKLDKIELLGNGKVNVVDYKTKAPMSANEIRGLTKSSTGNEWRQLLFYKILLDHDTRWRMESGQIDFLEPNASGKYKKETFTITPEMTEPLKATIIASVDRIRNLSFWNEKCDNRQCSYCQLRQLMK